MDNFANELVEKMTNRLVDRVNAAFDLDTTTLGKPGNLAIPQEDDTVADYDNQQDLESVLDEVLSLRGGKSAMKSPMKGKKPMNEYFTKLMAARKSGAKSFDYKG